MEITITPEMLAEAKAKREREKHLEGAIDPGTENICLGCE